MSELYYPDWLIRRILRETDTIAMVGASGDWIRPSYFAMKYLQAKGYRVIPVNPRLAGREILGERVYASLREIPEAVDMTDASQIPALAEPWFLACNASIDIQPVMTAQDLERAGPAIQQAAQKYG
jgi:predicted CoA-binding protein